MMQAIRLAALLTVLALAGMLGWRDHGVRPAASNIRC